jgi:tetratricopeptide (TPR) repeat protein
MLETIREYALERLEASGEADALRLRHAAHYLTLAERAAEDLVGPAQAAAIAVLERDHGNLRAALRWAIESGDVGRSLRFGAALWRFWRRRGYLTEGRERLGETLALAERASVPPDRSIQAAWGRALNGAGGLAYFQGDYAQASALQEQSLATCRRLGETRGVATALNDLGRVARMQGDLTRAETLQLESLALQRELGDDASAAETLVGLGVVAYHRGDYPAARGRYEEALTILRRLGHQQGIAATLGNLGRVASLQRDHATARALLEESLEAFRAIGDRWSVAVALDNLGYAALLRGDRAEAERLFDECLTLRLELGGRQGIAEVMEGFAGVAAATDPRRAARLAGAAETLRTELTAPLGPVERTRLDDLLAPARAALGDQAFAAEWATGTATPIADAIAVVRAGAA